MRLSGRAETFSSLVDSLQQARVWGTDQCRWSFHFSRQQTPRGHADISVYLQANSLTNTDDVGSMNGGASTPAPRPELGRSFTPSYAAAIRGIW